MLEQTGSLAYFFALLEKTCLGGNHPDYHTLLSALTQVLDSILLNAWRYESGYHNLREFAATEPVAKDLLKIAGDILSKHAMLMAMPVKTQVTLNVELLDEYQEAALTRRTSWRRSGEGVGLGPSGKQLHPATPELTAWWERPADSLQ